MCPFLSNLKTRHFLCSDLEWTRTYAQKETHRYSFKVLSGHLRMKPEPCLGPFTDSLRNDHKFFPHTRRGLVGPPCHSPLSCNTSFSHRNDTWPLSLISSLALSLIPFSFSLALLVSFHLMFSPSVSFCHWHFTVFLTLSYHLSFPPSAPNLIPA